MKILLVVFLSASTILAAETLRVPNGKHVMTDGQCDAAEWSEAMEKPVGTEYKLLFKKSSDFLYVCIKPAIASMFWVDLYISPTDDNKYTLHASAKLGERKFEGPKWKEWTPDWPWWQVSGWWANTLRPTNQSGFLPHRAIEFQIGRNRFYGKDLKVMFEIEGTKYIFPTGADNLKPETWMTLDLSK